MFELDDPIAPTADAELAVSRKTAGSEGQLTVDVYADRDDIVIKSTIAGVAADELDITLTKDRVTIQGARHNEANLRGKDYYHRELYWGAFSRSIILPEDVDPDKARAVLKNGLLTLRLPKLSKTQTKKVKISS